MSLTWRVPLSETTLGEEEAAAAADVVRSGWLTQGARVSAFESAFASMLGVPHAIAVANCTLALELGYQALGVLPGDEVIVPSLTFVAAANAARRLGALPVFADVRGPDDLTLDPVDVARKKTARTRVVCAVHFGGFAADVPAIQRAAGVPVLEDCAHAPGAMLEGRPCGALGEIGAFSFFGNKNLTTGEGGMVTTTREAHAQWLRTARSHGMTTSSWDRHRGHAFSYDVESVGTNARMDEMRAAVGLVQLGRLKAGNAVRLERVRNYRERLGGIGGLEIPFRGRSLEQSANHLFVVLLPPGADREAVMTELRERGIQSSVHYPPTHRFRAYHDRAATLPVTDAIAARILTLPLFSRMTEPQVDEVCDALRAAIARASR